MRGAVPPQMGPLQPPGRRPGDSFISQSMMAEGSGASARPSAAWGLGLGASRAGTRSGAAAAGGARGRRVAEAGGLISRVTGFSRIGESSRGTATRGLDAEGRAGIAACASIGAALTGGRGSGSAGRLASSDGAGVGDASAGKTRDDGGGRRFLFARGGVRWARGVVGSRPRRVVAQAREPPREVRRARDEERGRGDGHVQPTAPLGARALRGRARRRPVDGGVGRRRRLGRSRHTRSRWPR